MNREFGLSSQVLASVLGGILMLMCGQASAAVLASASVNIKSWSVECFGGAGCTILSSEPGFYDGESLWANSRVFVSDPSSGGIFAEDKSLGALAPEDTFVSLSTPSGLTTGSGTTTRPVEAASGTLTASTQTSSLNAVTEVDAKQGVTVTVTAGEEVVVNAVYDLSLHYSADVPRIPGQMQYIAAEAYLVWRTETGDDIAEALAGFVFEGTDIPPGDLDITLEDVPLELIVYFSEPGTFNLGVGAGAEVATLVPVPAALPLFGSALIGLVLVARRRMQTA